MILNWELLFSKEMLACLSYLRCDFVPQDFIRSSQVHGFLVELLIIFVNIGLQCLKLFFSFEEVLIKRAADLFLGSGRHQSTPVSRCRSHLHVLILEAMLQLLQLLLMQPLMHR